MRTVLALLLLAAGCATGPAVRPAGGQGHATATVAGAALTVFHAPWDGSPYGLARYVTPVAVEFYNGTALPLRVSFVDLILTDEAGQRFAAINPYTLAQHSEREARGPLVAWRGHGRFPVGPPPAARPAPMMRIGPPPPFRWTQPRHGLWGARHGYVVYPAYRPYFGIGIGYWGAPFIWPPGYASWVWAWSPAYFPAASPPSDVLAAGLPEGVLEPGGRVGGYLYFQRATDRSSRLTLTWEVHDAKSGTLLGQAPVALDVDRD